ncbi:MAG: dihydrolipoyllysine-residue acetyltransferase [Burkholderiales bacterium]
MSPLPPPQAAKKKPLVPRAMPDLVEVKVPDIGDYKDVPVIEVFVKPGDTVGAEESLITIESDKATMEVPSPSAGVVKELRVKVGDKVSEGSPVLVLERQAAESAGAEAKASEEKPATAPSAPPAPSRAAAPPPPAPAPSQTEPRVSPPRAGAEKASPTAALRADVDESAFGKAHASPSVRRLAREFGVDLSKVKGSGPKERILKEDVQNFVKAELAQPRRAGAAGPGVDLPAPPQVDFAKFGPVRSEPLARIKKISGGVLHRNWVSIPHVTQHEEADITELESFRKAQAEEAKKQSIRFTILGFLMKAAVVALRQFPEFNASLAADGESLVIKEYYHIGIAVDTPNGLVVPVIREVDKKGLLELARELGEVSERMRAGKISPADLQGGCFSISSLGGIGGSFFTPIINAPEVAILGVGKAVMKPVWNGTEFTPRLMLPLSLSYDHRVIDGALGARFISFLAGVLTDIRKLVL